MFVADARRFGRVSWRLRELAVPELRRFAAGERARALRSARSTPLDALELVGMLAGLVLVTALTRYVVPHGADVPRVVAAILDFAVALPLLALCLGPFHVRRLRRGLRDRLQRQELN